MHPIMRLILKWCITRTHCSASEPWGHCKLFIFQVPLGSVRWVQAVRRALEEIVLKKRPPVVPKAPPKLRQIQAPQPSKPGQRQLELVYVHECRSALSSTWPQGMSEGASVRSRPKHAMPIKDMHQAGMAGVVEVMSSSLQLSDIHSVFTELQR